MTGSIAPNRPGHHGTVVARTVGTVAISCNVFLFHYSLVGDPTPGLKLTPAPLWLKLNFIGISMVEHNFLVNSGNLLYKCG